MHKNQPTPRETETASSDAHLQQNGCQDDATSFWLRIEATNPSFWPKPGTDGNPSAVGCHLFHTTTPRQCHSAGSIHHWAGFSSSVELVSEPSEEGSVEK